MSDHKRCPECDSYQTEVVHTEFYEDMVERVRICNDCPTQWDVVYGLPSIENVEVFDDE